MPIIVFPPSHIQVSQREQSEAEHDIFDALFKESKVSSISLLTTLMYCCRCFISYIFIYASHIHVDQFMVQSKVLHNYANVLELLLRLRQCCNHPFLVISLESLSFEKKYKLLFNW